MTANTIRRERLTQLDQCIKSLAGQERELLCELIEKLQEMNRCKGYLELGFPSLFAYLHEGVGYSEGSAHRRIEAARLVTEIPEMLIDIKSGDLKLTQISLVQKVAREKLKTTSRPVTTTDKKTILQKIIQKNFKKSQQQVAQFFDLPVKEQTQETVQADDSVRLEITIPRQVFENMKRAQALISHSVPNKDWADYLAFMTDAYLKRQATTRNIKPNPATVSTMETENSVAEPAKRFSPRQRKLLLKSAPVCQYRDPVTDKQCHSEWFLQMDHKHSRWAGGTTTLNNAQVLCGAHNRLKYSKEARLC